jgi:cell wall-associated NlpC family hydrolase
VGCALHDLIGIPFVNRGRDPKIGLDCFGLAREAMRLFGYDIPDFDVSCFDVPSIHAIYDKQRARWAWQKVDSPEPGDLIVMYLDPRYPDQVSHVGVCIGNGRAIHTLIKRESHLIRLDDPYWKIQCREFYRWAG